MPEALAEEVNPNGNLLASVETDGRSCYLYLHGDPDSGFGVRSVWVRNLIDAPDALDFTGMQEGRPPANPAEFCVDPSASPPPAADRLHFVWLPEGNGVALYEEESLLAIIPPWSGEQGCHGFARDAVGTGPLAWELGPDNVLRQRFADARRFWTAWSEPDAWGPVQQQLFDGAVTVFGEEETYYAIDGGNWPPKALLRFTHRDAIVLLTIGVSIRPQPGTDPYDDVPERPRRMELGAAVPKSWPEESVMNLARYLSAASALPWNQYVWLGRGHTLDCDSWRNPRFECAVLSSDHPAAPTPDFAPYFGDAIRVLWFLPMTRAECDDAAAHRNMRRTPMPPEDRWAEA